METVELWSVDGFDGEAITFEVDSVEGVAGDTIIFPTYQVESINGEVDVLLYYQYENGKKQPIINDSLFLNNAGKYTFTYEYTDGYYQGIYSYEFDCDVSDKMSLLDGLPFPKYYIKGATYSFNDAYVYSFDEVKSKKNLINVSISQDGGAYAVLNKFNQKITASNSIRFKLE